VQRPGEHPLAGAVLAAEEHRRLGRRDPAGEVEDPPELRVAPLQLGFGNLAVNVILQVGNPIPQPPEPGHPLEHGPDLGRGKRLGQIVKRTPPHRLDRRVDRGVRRDHHDRQPGELAQQRLQEVETRLDAELQINQRDIMNGVLDGANRLGPRGRLRDRVPRGLQRRPERPANVGLVVDNQHPHAHRPHRVCTKLDAWRDQTQPRVG
jgi:hypothetical protein